MSWALTLEVDGNAVHFPAFGSSLELKVGKEELVVVAVSEDSHQVVEVMASEHA